MVRGLFFSKHILESRCLFVYLRRNREKKGGDSQSPPFVQIYLKERKMIDKHVVAALAEEKLKESESYLVDVQVKPGNLIVVEIDNDEGIDIEECILISKHIEANLDREAEDFELEVGSAGITAPFKVTRQYQKNIGNEVEVLSRNGIKQYGILKSADDAGFVITVTKKVKPEGAKRKIEVEEDNAYGYDEVKYVKYVLDFK